MAASLSPWFPEPSTGRAWGPRRPHPVLVPRRHGLSGLGALQVLSPAVVGTIASTIQSQEGYFPGSVAYRNNNPGNLLFVGQAGATLGDRGFARFSSYDAGFDALQNQIQLYAGRGLTIDQMMGIYAPASDGNNPAAYARRIAAALGVGVDTPLSALAGGGGVAPAPVYQLEETPVFSTDVFGTALSDAGAAIADVVDVVGLRDGWGVAAAAGFAGLLLLLLFGGEDRRRVRYS